MTRRYLPGVAVLALGFGVIIWSIVDAQPATDIGLAVGAATAPLGVLLLLSARLDRDPPWAVVVGGGVIGGLVAIASHSIVLGFAYAFFLGFADAASNLLDALRVDPRVSSVVGSPWTVVALIELVAVAPITEEIGKALGSRVRAVQDRQSAFLAGVAAGTGFAILENILYASSSGFFGQSWQTVVVARMLGVAVHPLASGLVVLGWWEWRNGAGRRAAFRRFLSGVGIHALWNGSLVVLGVTATAFEIEQIAEDLSYGALAYSSTIGVVVGWVLWKTPRLIGGDHPDRPADGLRDGRALAAWTVLAASFLVPVAILLITASGP